MAAPSTPSLAYKLETLAIDMLSEHERLAGLSIVHHAEDEPAEINRIVCTATLGEREQGGVRPWNVSLEVRVYVTERDAGLIEDHSKAVDETFTAFPQVDSMSEFDYLAHTGEDDEDKDAGRDSRQRGKTYTFHALESGMEDDALEYVTRAGIYDVTERLIVNDLVLGLKDDATWPLISELWIPAGASDFTHALQKIKGATSTVCTTNIATHQWRYFCPRGPSVGIDALPTQWITSPPSNKIKLSASTSGMISGALIACGTWGANATIMNGRTGADADALTLMDTTTPGVNYIRMRMHGSNTAIHRLSADGTPTGTIIGVRAGGSLKLIKNGAALASLAGGAADASIATEYELMGILGSIVVNQRTQAICIAPNATEAQALSIGSRLEAALQAFGAPGPTSQALNVSYHGDSLTMGSSAYNEVPFSYYLRDEYPAWSGRHANLARSGFITSEMVTRYAASTWLKPDGAYFSTARSYAFVLGGTNDLGASGLSAAAVLSNLRSLWAALTSDGWKPIAITIPPRDDVGWSGTKEAQRVALNTSIRADGPNYHTLFDLDALMVAAGITPASTAYFQSDKLHFKAAMYEWVAERANEHVAI